MGQIFRNIIGALLALALCYGSVSAQTTPQAEALFRQGKAYHDGVEQTQDLRLAKQLYEAAIEAGSNNARINLAYMYFLGEGVPQNYERARMLYTAAAKTGDEAAAKNLAFMDRERLGIPKAAPPSLAIKATTVAPKVSPTQPIAIPKVTLTPIASDPVLPTPAEVARISPPNRNYANLEASSSQSAVIQEAGSITPKGRQFSTFTVFGGIILFAGFVGLSLGWAWEYWHRRKRIEQHKLARLFFEHNRRVLREIYLRYPEPMRRLANRESPLAVMLSVLMVRYVIFHKASRDKDSLNIASEFPEKLGASILAALPEHPARARHICVEIMPQVIDLIHSDIRAFDIEATTDIEMPVVFKNPRRHPRRIGWKPKVIKAS